MEPNTKICPFCGELIKSDAQKCRYCREWLKDVHEGKSVDPEAVVEQMVDEVKTDISVGIFDAPQETIPISGIVPEKIVSETKTYPSGTIILFDGNKVRSKLKNFYKNRFLPFYQNSYLLFFILTTLIYGGGNFLKNALLMQCVDRRWGMEFLAYISFSSNILTIPYIIVSALSLAAGMIFISMRNDEEKLRKSVQNFVLPVAVIAGVITVFGLVAPEQLALLTYRQELLPKSETFYRILRMNVMAFAINSIVNFLLMILLARGQFGRLFLCMLAGVIARLMLIFPDDILVWLSVVEGIDLLLPLFFCRKLLFKNFHFEFDREIIEKFLWTTLCIAVTMYFGNKCCNCYVSCGQMFALSTGRMPLLFVLLNIPFILLGPCIWAGRLADNKQRLGFMLKTLIFAIVYVFVRTLFYYYLCIPSDTQAEWMLTELLNFALLLCPVLLVKAVSNAYYCSCKWFFIIPINMFLSLLGSLAVVQLVFPTVFSELQKLPLEIHAAVQYSWGFLILLWSIDLLALIHAIISLKKPIRTGRTFYIVSGIISAIIMFGGIWAVNHVQSRIDAVLRAAGELK